jgi:hypothetical protein
LVLRIFGQVVVVVQDGAVLAVVEAVSVAVAVVPAIPEQVLLVVAQVA